MILLFIWDRECPCFYKGNLDEMLPCLEKRGLKLDVETPLELSPALWC